jgi:hypothetical protein
VDHGVRAWLEATVGGRVVADASVASGPTCSTARPALEPRGYTSRSSATLANVPPSVVGTQTPDM